MAKQRLHVATQLAAVLPDVDAALVDGRISWEHARVLSEATNDRNAEAMAAASDRFVELARTMVFAKWRAKVLAYAALMDPDGTHNPNDISRNRLTLSPSDRFMLLRGELTGDDALLVETAVNQVADELFRQAVRDHHASGGELPVPDRATLRALAWSSCADAASPSSWTRRSRRAPSSPSTPTPSTGLQGIRRCGGSPTTTTTHSHPRWRTVWCATRRCAPSPSTPTANR